MPLGHPRSRQLRVEPAGSRGPPKSQGWVYDSTGANKPGATPLYRKDTAGNLVDGLSVRFYTLNTRPQWEIAARDIVAWLAQAGNQTTDRLGRTRPGHGPYNTNHIS